MPDETKKRKTKTSSAVKRRYNKKAYDTASAYLKKGQLAFLKKIAEEHNTSVSSLIIDSLTKYLAEEYNIDFNDFPATEEQAD